MIQENIIAIQKTLPAHVTLVAVSKTKPETDIIEAYKIGVRNFGENKVQELTRKYESLPKDILWHYIGHLQTNKIKYIAPFIHLIHGVDSLKLLQAINKEGEKCNRIIPCLLQFHIAQEETKFGLTIEEAEEALQSIDYKDLQNIQIQGVMGMASYSDDIELVRNEFKELKQIFTKLKTRYFSNESSFQTISMGMSQDFQLAIEEGSTMVRVGSSIFGERIYL